MEETWQEKDARLRHTPGNLLAYAMDDEYDDAIGFIEALRDLHNSDYVTEAVTLLRKGRTAEARTQELTEALENAAHSLDAVGANVPAEVARTALNEER